jgi:hypothetical protein
LGVLAIALLFTAIAWTASAAVVDRVLAVVDGQLVLLSDLRTARALGTVTEDDPAAAVERLVDRRLMIAEASRYAPQEPAPGAVEARLASLRDAAGADRFAEVLALGGIDEAALRRSIRDDLILEAYLDQRFSATAQPTDGEVDAYLASRRSELVGADGEPLPQQEATTTARARLLAERRRVLVADWLAGLRRRADISVRPIAPVE